MIEVSTELFVMNGSLQRAYQISRTEFFKAERSWHSEGALILLLINLSDVLKTLQRYDRKVNFSENFPDGVDATDYIGQFRNAICHSGSASRRIGPGGTIFSFIVVMGKKVEAVQIGEFKTGNPFEDEVAFFYGVKRLFLKRHIDRAIREAKHKLDQLAQDKGVTLFPRWKYDQPL